jgi:tetratricopeptide (TPR) repeat protein
MNDGWSAKCYYNLATNYQLLGRYETAIFFYSQALYLDPHFAMAYYSRANTYFNAGDYFQASIDFTSVLDVSLQQTRQSSKQNN